MYSSLVLAALLPLSGPTAGDQLASLSVPVRVESRVVPSAVDPADRIPALPLRTRVAYAANGETPDRAWSPPPAVTPPGAVHQAPPPPSPPPVTPSTFAKPPNQSGVIELRGKLEVPHWNRAVVAANFQAQLMSLKTEQKSSDGQPVMIPLREGMQVVKGQVLGKFDDREISWSRKIAECELNVAKAEAEKQIEVKYAADSVRTEQAGLAMLKEANSRHEGAVSQMEVLQAELKVVQALANYELQDYNLKIVKSAEAEAKAARLSMADVLVQLRQIVSPISGTIVKVDKAEGEWLREGDPVLEIVQLGTLQVVCKVDANQYDQNSVADKAVSVVAPLPNGKLEEFSGKVVFADPKIDSGDTFDVYIDVQNRPIGNSWLLQPGRMVVAVIKL